MKKKLLLGLNGLVVLALASCGVVSYTHTHHKYLDCYTADINHDGKFEDYVDPFDHSHIFHENGGLTWADSYDLLINEANSTAELSAIADNLHIAADEPERTSLARYEVLHEAEELLMSTNTMVPIYNYADPYLLKDNVQGIYCSSLGSKFFDQLTGHSDKKYSVSVGTKADTLDPAENSDAATSMITANVLLGIKRWVKGDPFEQYSGTFHAEVDDGIATVEKLIIVEEDGDPSKGTIDIDDCEDLKELAEEERAKFINTARYEVTINEDAVWSVTNKPITKGDFFWAWRRAASAQFGIWNSMFDAIRGYKEWITYTQEQIEKGEEVDYDDAKNIFNGLIPFLSSDGTKDDRHFSIQLINDCSYFDELLAFPAFVPLDRETIEKAGSTWWLNPNTYSCNGPFKFKTIDNKETGNFVLVRNDTYFDKASVIPEEVTFALLDEDSAMLNRYKSDTLCMIDTIAAGMIDEVMATMPTQWKVADQVGIYYMLLNANDNTFDIKPETDPKQGEREREAMRGIINLLINRADISRNITKSGATAANGFVSSGIMENCYPVWDSAEYDPVTKEQTGAYVADRDENGDLIATEWHSRNGNLYKEAMKNGGYAAVDKHWLSYRNNKNNGFWKVPTDPKSTDQERESMEYAINEATKLAEQVGIKYDGDKFINFPDITVTTNTGTGHEAICERMQAYYKLFGINLSIQTQEWNAFLATKNKGDFAMARNGWIADFSDARTYLDISVSDNGNNDAQLGKDSWHKSR